MTTDAPPLRNRSLLKLVAAAVPVLLVLIMVPSLVGTYQLQLVIYGLIAAIAALGFNLLLGYTGLLSFGHSAYFGVGAYSVALLHLAESSRSSVLREPAIPPPASHLCRSQLRTRL
jgi:ABC-type branched-subunit amino acid transport system permease subunit